MASVEDLQAQLSDALQQLADKERDLIMAAEFGNALLQSNEKLQQQLDGANRGGNGGGDDASGLRIRLRETEKAADRQIQALQRTNQTLQQDLRAALQDMRRAETEHTKEVKGLESDLEALRYELERNAKDNAALNKAAKLAAKDDAAAADADEAIFTELHKEVASLKEWKKEAEKTIKQTTTALQESLVRVQDQQDRLDAAASMRQEFERRGTLILELKEQIEDLRVHLADAQEQIGGEVSQAAAQASAGFVSKYDGKEWEWSPWIESVKGKVWERNLTGLKEEVDELRKHREEAYRKLKEEMDTMVVKFVDQLPESVRLGMDKVGTTISGVLPAVSGIFVPAQLTGASEKATDEGGDIESVVAMFPNVPRSDIEKDLKASGSVRLTIENILNGFVKEPTTDSGLNLCVVNADEPEE
ncbi:hypothetical protein BC830DRAFT_1092415 [Chytriomyces sp. MP71]|nr:hypothetical protein BC830DRAFT_1092415 [Chytriomyces sp. MP71]